MPEENKQPRLVDVDDTTLMQATDKAWRKVGQGTANREGWLLLTLLVLLLGYGAYRLLWR